MKIISIIGPESSGKTLLSKSIAKILDCSIVEEYAREYLKNKKIYDIDDLENIAIRQHYLIKNKSYSNKKEYLVVDTSNITIEIWSKLKFNTIGDKVSSIVKAEKFYYYLLCKPDIPWEYDSLRENPNDRDKIFNEHLKLILKRKYNYKIVQGDLNNRIQTSIDFITNSK